MTRLAPLLLPLSLLLCACQSEPPAPAPAPPALPAPDETTGTDQHDNLSLILELPANTFRVGQSFTPKLIARNTSATEGVRIRGNTGAPFYLHLLAHDGVSWQRIKTYPEAATMAMTEWVLPAGAERTFTPTLRVEPDWPTYQHLRLQAVLNGREDVNPFVTIEVLPKQ